MTSGRQRATSVTPVGLCIVVVILVRMGAAFAAPPGCSDPQCSERALESLHLVPADNAIAPPQAVSGALSRFLLSHSYAGWRRDTFPRTNDIRLTGPFIDKKDSRPTRRCVSTTRSGW